MSPFYKSHVCTGENMSCMCCVSHVQQAYQVAKLFQSPQPNSYNDCNKNFATPLKSPHEEALENASIMMEASRMHTALHLQQYKPNYKLREPQILPYDDSFTICTSHNQQSYQVDKPFQSPYSNPYDNYNNSRYHNETPIMFPQRTTAAAIPIVTANSKFHNTPHYPTNQPVFQQGTVAATPITFPSPNFRNIPHYRTNQPDLKVGTATPITIATNLILQNMPYYQTNQPDLQPVTRATSPIKITSSSLHNTQQYQTKQQQPIQKQTLYSPPILAETSREPATAFATPITIASSSLHNNVHCHTNGPNLQPIPTTPITIAATSSLHNTPDCYTNKPDLQLIKQKTLQSPTTLIAETSRKPDVQPVTIATTSLHNTFHSETVNKPAVQLIKQENLQSPLTPTESLSKNQNDSDTSIVEPEDTEDESFFCKTEYFVQKWTPQSISNQEDSWFFLLEAPSVSSTQSDVMDESFSSTIKTEAHQSPYYNSQSTSNTFSTYVSHAGLQDPLRAFQFTHTITDPPVLNNGPISKAKKSQKRSYVRCTCPNCSVEGGNKIKGPNGKPQHICHIPYCERIFSSSSDLKIHLGWHSGKINYVCEQCNKGYLRKHHLRRHIKIHHTDGCANRKIPEIEITFTSPKSSETNTDNVRPQLSCRIAGCGKIFYDAKYLTAHLKQDHGVKPYVCTWPNCDRSFNATRSLQIHLKSHRAMEIFVCPYCRMGFGGDASLKRHISSTHEKR